MKNKLIKYLLIITYLFLVGIVNVNAKIPEKKNREELENSGVNKKWIESDEVTNAYFVKLESTGKIFSGKEVENVLLSLSTVYKDIK